MGFYSVGLEVSTATRWAAPTWARLGGQARPGGLCPPRCPPPVGLGSRNSYLLYKNPRKVLFHSENFISAQKQHHGSSAENIANLELVSLGLDP